MNFTKDVYDWQRESQEAKYDDILRIFPEIKGTILSIGIGPGWFEERLEGDIYGIDINKDGPFNYTQGDGNDLPYEDELFDFIVSIDSIHFIENYTEIERVLKKGGHLVIATHKHDLEDKLLQAFGTLRAVEREIVGNIERERDLLLILQKE